MDEYYPSYIKNNNICPKCHNKIKINKNLITSYLNECKKCQRMGLYGENQMLTLNNQKIPRSHYTDICECKTEYIYKYIYECEKCIKCEKCNLNISKKNLNNINNINQKILCETCN